MAIALAPVAPAPFPMAIALFARMETGLKAEGLKGSVLREAITSPPPLINPDDRCDHVIESLLVYRLPLVVNAIHIDPFHVIEFKIKLGPILATPVQLIPSTLDATFVPVFPPTATQRLPFQATEMA